MTALADAYALIFEHESSDPVRCIPADRFRALAYDIAAQESGQRRARDRGEESPRDALLNDLKVVLRGAMKPGMSHEEVESIHLDAIEWLAWCLAFGSGTSRDRIRDRTDKGEKSGRRMRS